MTDKDTKPTQLPPTEPASSYETRSGDKNGRETRNK